MNMRKTMAWLWTINENVMYIWAIAMFKQFLLLLVYSYYWFQLTAMYVFVYGTLKVSFEIAQYDFSAQSKHLKAYWVRCQWYFWLRVVFVDFCLKYQIIKKRSLNKLSENSIYPGRHSLDAFFLRQVNLTMAGGGTENLVWQNWSSSSSLTWAYSIIIIFNN